MNVILNHHFLELYNDSAIENTESEHLYFISHVGEIFRQTIRWNFFYYNLNSGKILVRALGLSHFNGVLQLTTGKFRGPTLEGLVNSSPAAFSPAVDVGSLHVQSVFVNKRYASIAQ